MVSINPTMSIIALYINGLNIPIKRHIVRLNKRTTQLQETYFKYKDSDTLSMRGRRKKHHAKTNQEKNWNDYINFKQNSLQNEENYQR